MDLKQIDRLRLRILTAVQEANVTKRNYEYAKDTCFRIGLNSDRVVIFGDKMRHNLARLETSRVRLKKLYAKVLEFSSGKNTSELLYMRLLSHVDHEQLACKKYGDRINSAIKGAGIKKPSPTLKDFLRNLFGNKEVGNGTTKQ